MKKTLFILTLIIVFGCEPISRNEVALPMSIRLYPYKYENHDYLIFRGVDNFSAVVHSASCHYCDSIKNSNLLNQTK
jgi:hypothetical protein